MHRLFAAPRRLQQEVERRAEGLAHWRTDRYARLARRNAVLLPALRQELDALWNSYSRLPVADHEVTLESVTFHRLLKRGFNAWNLALDLAQKGEWNEALAVAEGATRLLLAIAQVQGEVVRAVGRA
jgi:hypothetical protein